MLKFNWVIKMNLGSRIAKLRKEKGITQQQLAELIYVTDKTISSWESNRTEPNLEMIIKISEILDGSIGYLIYGDNPKNDIETEIKIKLSNYEFKIIENIMKSKGEFLKNNKQYDTYYQPLHRKFLKENKETINEWLRIGIRGNKKILNYKNWYNNMYCDEYEVEIDNDKNLDKIFGILGLEKIAVVNKIRNTYLYLNKYEVALDYVDNLGYFIEIEVKKYNDNAIKEYDNLIKIAKNLNLNLNNIDKRGYPYHIIYKD